MILSTSSSRAVSIRIGTSELWRMRLQTSIPSMSGSIRSSTISAGCCDAACCSASPPVVGGAVALDRRRALADGRQVDAVPLQLHRVLAAGEEEADVVARVARRG